MKVFTRFQSGNILKGRGYFIDLTRDGTIILKLNLILTTPFIGFATECESATPNDSQQRNGFQNHVK